MDHYQWSRENFEQWIENSRLLEIALHVPQGKISLQGRMLEYDLANDEIKVYNEFENRIDKIKLRMVDCITDEIDHYIDSDNLT